MQIYLHCFNKMCGFSRKFYINLHKIAGNKQREMDETFERLCEPYYVRP